jgi:hypothetical protein
MNCSTLDDARGAKAKALRLFGDQAEVVGVGITEIDGGYGVKVNLRETPRRGISLPKSVDGVPVRVEIVGTISKR